MFLKEIFFPKKRINTSGVFWKVENVPVGIIKIFSLLTGLVCVCVLDYSRERDRGDAGRKKNQEKEIE
jgi:hypothetical protein